MAEVNKPFFLPTRVLSESAKPEPIEHYASAPVRGPPTPTRGKSLKISKYDVLKPSKLYCQE